MLIRYEGPLDQYDHEVGQALALARQSVVVELPAQHDGAQEGDVVLATDPASEASSRLEPGRVYDLPARMAEHRLETSAHWSKVTKIADLPIEELRRLAAERDVEGRSKMDAKQLAKAVSAAAPATAPDPQPEAAEPAGTAGGAPSTAGGAPAPAPTGNATVGGTT